jgi:hypothetical protein
MTALQQYRVRSFADGYHDPTWLQEVVMLSVMSEANQVEVPAPSEAEGICGCLEEVHP